MCLCSKKKKKNCIKNQQQYALWKAELKWCEDRKRNPFELVLKITIKKNVKEKSYAPCALF